MKKELTRFIPGTTEGCRRLLEELRDSKDSITIADRYGRSDTIDSEEIAELTALVERQIGEKTPARPTPPVPDTIPAVKDKAQRKPKTKKQ